MKHTDPSPLHPFVLVQKGKVEKIQSTKAVVIITNPTGKILVTKHDKNLLLPGGYHNGQTELLEQKVAKQIGQPVTLTRSAITRFKRTRIIVFTGTIEKAKKGLHWIDPNALPTQLSSLGVRIIKNFKSQSQPTLRAV